MMAYNPLNFSMDLSVFVYKDKNLLWLCLWGKLLFKCCYYLLSSLITFHNQSKVGRMTVFCRNSVNQGNLGPSYNLTS